MPDASQLALGLLLIALVIAAPVAWTYWQRRR